MKIYNPPLDTSLKNSLDTLLQKSFSDSKNRNNYLYLVENTDEVESLDTKLASIFPSDANVFVNTLFLETALKLRECETQLRERDVTVISDYSDPFNSREDKRVSFHSSEDCRPFISHVYSEIMASLSDLIQEHGGLASPIGSDQLPDFPCKIDTDILVCIPNKSDYISFCSQLKEGKVFTIPPQIIGDKHIFFYAQLLGSPIDLHVCNDVLEENSLYRQAMQLRNDSDLQQKYRQFKINNEGSSASAYRKAKSLFRKNAKWSQ